MRRSCRASVSTTSAAPSPVKNGQTRNTASTPSRFSARPCGFERSPDRRSTPGCKPAVSGSRTSARTTAWRSSSPETTWRPTLPVAPITKIMQLLREHREVELTQALGVGEEVDLDDPPLPDGDAADRERLSVAEGDDADGAVDQRDVDVEAEARVHLRLADHGLRASDLSARSAGPEVGPQHHVRIEHLDQGLELPFAGRGQEGIDDSALGVEVGIGDRSLAPHASSG